MIVVVGIGADGMAGLSENSLRELRSANAIYGSPRQLDLLDDTVAALRNPWPTPMRWLLGRLKNCGPSFWRMSQPTIWQRFMCALPFPLTAGDIGCTRFSTIPI